MLTGRPELADDLHDRVRANIDEDEIDELMWGTAGTLVAAQALLEGTGEERWRRACDDSAAALLARRDADGLWTQRRFKDTRSLGPVHGFVGNVHALLTALDGERAERLRRETNDTLTRFAVREGALCNWPPGAEEGLEHRRTGEIRLQWCHGAPGIVTTAAPYLDEELLLAGAELTWTAGRAPGAEGRRDLPRDGGQRLRAPRSVRAHRRRAVARTRAPFRRARPRPGRARAARVLALARRDRGRSLRLRLPRRGLPLPVPRARGRAMTLYQPEWHEPLDGDWDEERARAGIRAVVADADAAFGAESLWPANDWDSWRTPTPLKSLYVGAAGVIWALDHLRSRGYAEPQTDLAAAAEETLAEWRREPDLMAEIELPSTKESGLLSGETGILLVAFGLTRDAELADDLYERVRENEQSEAEDVMWGTPGTLVAARQMLDLTGDERWRHACRAGADALWSRRDGEGYWTQRLHGEEYRGLGTAHGLVGNVQALRPLLDAERREQLERDTNALLARSAFVEDGLANWAYIERPQLASAAGEIRLQWCAGAPGIVVAAARLPRPRAAARGRRARLAGGAADAGEGRRHLPRHRRQRLRAARRVRAHRRRGVARPRPSLRGPCARAGRA